MITYNVTITLNEQDGDKLAAASVSVKLDKPDIDSADGFIVPESKTFTTDANGQSVMALWPNARGSEGSVYNVTVTHPTTGKVLFTATMSVPEADSDFFAIATVYSSPAMLPFPAADDTREQRIVDDLKEFMKQRSDSDTRLKKWIAHVLNDAKRYKRWWFLEFLARTTIPAGCDVIDLKGDIDRVKGIWAPERLDIATVQQVTEKRAFAIVNSKPNAGPVSHYALEAGKRVHLWPAPEEEVNLWVLYQRPLEIQIVPAEWETIIFEGVIGKYGAYFDRDALLYEPRDYLNSYKMALREFDDGNFDRQRVLMPHELLDGTTTVDTLSASELTSAKTVPASLSGVGNDQVYVFTVG